MISPKKLYAIGSVIWIASGLLCIGFLIWLGLLLTYKVSDELKNPGISAAECYASFKFGLLDLESTMPNVRERGQARLWATLDLCFPSDGDKPRPSRWMISLDVTNTQRAIDALRDGWSRSEVGEPWKGTTP